jgi:hypothetical protein
MPLLVLRVIHARMDGLRPERVVRFRFLPSSIFVNTDSSLSFAALDLSESFTPTNFGCAASKWITRGVVIAPSLCYDVRWVFPCFSWAF